jgi:hypothetical protein
MMKPALLAFAPDATAVAIAGCGGSSGATGYSKAAPSNPAGTATPTVALPASGFGKIPVGPNGHGMEIHNG